MATIARDLSDTLRRAAIVQRARATDAPDPGFAITLADLLERGAAAVLVNGGGPSTDDLLDSVSIAQDILSHTCARPLPASSIGSVCGRRTGHDGGCGAPVASMPGLGQNAVTA